jgi:hypothetical protein
MRRRVMRMLALALLAVCAPALSAEDPCAGFAWDVHHERQLFALDPQTLVAGKTVALAPALAPDRLYELELRAQPEVSFAVPPGKTWPAEATYAGLASLTVAAAGLYRIALDQAAWVDVVAHGAALRSRDFQARHACSAPHKIVEFELPAGTALTLQFSGGVVSTIRVTVTRAPVEVLHQSLGK